MEKDKAVVISIDAMTAPDFSELLKRENFARLTKDYSIVSDVECIFPSYTYPSHAAIITGCHADRTGIWHNEKLAFPDDRREWNWWEKDLKCRTIIEYANENGLKTAAISWPVTAGGNALYTIPEIWPASETVDADALYRAAVSEKAWPFFEKNRWTLERNKEHYYDIYTTENAASIILGAKPDLSLIHLSALDSVKHTSGSSPSVLQEAYDFIDQCIGKIVNAAKEAGTKENTTFFLLGDHGQKDIKRVLGINRILADMGYIKLNGGRIEEWRILCHPSAFTSVVYLKDIGEDEAYLVFEDIKREYPGVIKKIYRAGEAEEKYRIKGPFGLVLESEGNTIFSFSPLLEPLSKRKDGQYSTHGYAPGDGPDPVFAVCGKKAAKNLRIEKARLTDEGPTILSLFGITMKDTDGSVIEGLVIPR